MAKTSVVVHLQSLALDVDEKVLEDYQNDDKAGLYALVVTKLMGRIDKDKDSVIETVEEL